MGGKTDSDAKCGRLDGRRVLITGAASGIGRATAELFSEEGAALALLDRDAQGLHDVAERIGGFSAVVDLCDEAAIRRAVADSAAALGGLDGVVNVAGIGGDFTRLGDLQLPDWNKVIAVNLTAPFLVMREALPHLAAAKGKSSIVNVSSGQGLIPSSPGMASYCASKGGLVTFSKAMALELGPDVRVNAVCPGVVDTPLVPATMKQFAASAQSPYALKRIAEPREIAASILFLISAESRFVTGIALAVDGGRTYH
jgi:NAD(P)-dependent dehydrogenase (short-subunit alcohol dehydrogenase family)